MIAQSKFKICRFLGGKNKKTECEKIGVTKIRFMINNKWFPLNSPGIPLHGKNKGNPRGIPGVSKERVHSRRCGKIHAL